MRVHAARHLGVATLEVVRHHKFLEHVRRLHAHDVRAEQLAVLLVADDLDLAAAVAVDRPRAHGAHRDLADHNVVAGLLRLLLGEAEARHLRVTERRPRDVVVLDRMGVHPGSVLHRDHALVGSLVGERRADRHEVADRVHALQRGAHRAVHLHLAGLVAHLDAGLLETEPLHIRPAPGSDAQVVELLGVAAEGQLHAVLLRLRALDVRAGDDLYVLLGDFACRGLRDLLVLERQDLGKRFEQGDLGAEPAKGRAHLDARCAAADHGKGPRQLVQGPCGLRTEHPVAEAEP